MNMLYRHLSADEISQLERQMCHASDWGRIMVAEDFNADYVLSARFSGDVRLGVFESEFELAGGMKKHSGLYHVTLHNVDVGDNCCIENVKNYIANYSIGHDSFIENVDTFFLRGSRRRQRRRMCR